MSPVWWVLFGAWLFVFVMATAAGLWVLWTFVVSRDEPHGPLDPADERWHA